MTTMMTPAAAARLEAALANAGEPRALDGETTTRVLLAVFELDSGASLALDETGAWWIVPEGDRPARSAARQPAALGEVIETKRHEFERALEAAATEAGLDGRATVESFPFVPVAVAMLGSLSSYLLRLALEWLRPAELREARAAIEGIAKRKDLPSAVKALAAHLLVPT